MAMNRQRKTSNVLNILNYDDAGNIVIKDYGQVTRYSWNGLIHGFVGPVSVSSVSAATTDTDRFLVSDGGVLKYRTGVELLSDIGGVPSARTLTINGTSYDLSADRSWTISAGISGTGASGQVAYWNGTNSQTGSNNFLWDNANQRLSITGQSAISTTTLSAICANGTLSLNNASQHYVDVTLSTTSNQGSVSNLWRNNSSLSGALVMYSSAEGNNLFGTSRNSAFALLNNSGTKFYIGTINSTDLIFGTTNLERMRLFAGGNFALGGSADGGQRLQVYGDAYIKGSGATSATNALLVQNTNGTELLRIQNDGTTIARAIGNNNTTPIFAATQQNGNTRFSVNALGQTFIGGDANAATDTLLRIERNFNPTSGTATHTTTLIIPTINQTGGANGITRGLYVNPTLTAAADWRSIEWSNNSGWGLYGAGTANNYLGGNLTISRNQNGGTNVLVSNTTSGNSSAAFVRVTSSNGFFDFGKLSATTDPYRLNKPNDSVIYNAGAGDIAIFNDFPTGGIKFATGGSGTQIATFTAAGRLLLNTVSEGTFLLDVNGTARVSGNTTISLNQNAATTLTISNTTSGTSAVTEIVVASDTGAGSLILGKYSTTKTAYKFVNGKDVYCYNTTVGGDIAILNDFATGSIKMGAGGSSTAQMTLTAAGRLLLGTTTEGTFLLDVNGTARVSGALLISGSTGAVAGSLWSDASNGLALSAKAGTTYDFVLYDKNGVRQISFGTSGFVSSAGTYGGIKIGQSGSPSVFLDSTFGLAITGTGTSIDSALFTRGGLDFAGINQNGNFRIGNYLSTYNASAILEAVSTTKGFLPPRMTTTQKNAIATPAAGLVVYDNTDNYLSLYNGTNWQNTVSPNSAGNVLIGVAIDLGYKLQVSSTVYTINGGVYSDLNSTINQALYATNQSLTGAASNGMVYLETTWNTTGNPSAIYLNVTNTASGSFSKLLDLRVGLTPVFQVDKSGGVFTGQPIGGSNGVWKFGQYNATAPSATGYVEVEVNGTLYKLLAST